MDILELCDMIEIPPDITIKLKKCYSAVPWKKIEPYLQGMMVREKAAESYQALQTHLREDEGNLKMLFCQLECARRIYLKYQEQQIPHNIFIDTMKCFQRFLHECERRTGKRFFDRGWWTYRQLSMSLFRIGELEYELRTNGGENVISLHIPSDADFSPAMVDKSLKQSKHFFRQYFPAYKQARYICNSWLLSPTLKPLLPIQSNILDFQRRFVILQIDECDQEWLEWLFQTTKDTKPSNLPEKTQLQKAVKNLLLEGGNIGSACGIIQKEGSGS